MDEAAPPTGGHWVHDLDPFLFQFGDGFGIRWYGLAYLFGLLAGWWLMRRWSRRGLIPINDQAVADCVMYIGLGMILGGRLGYCIFYKPELFITWMDHLPFWGVLAINEGGMASHGGIIGFFIGGWLFARRHGVSVWVFGDGVATGIPVGIMAGRIANFINGELWGRATDVPWGVIFPGAPGALEGIARHPSQLYAVVLEGLIPFLCSLAVYGRHRRPGLNVGIILSTYACGRFIGEFFREPDAHLGFVLGQLSMGQILTLPVLAVGLFFIWNAFRRPPRPELYEPRPAAAAEPVQA
jgi:phosphatidylglycerol:prolipoprotein diacylglycerol transferase